MFRRRLLGAAPALALLSAPGLRAQPAWPSQPVRLVVAFAPGGVADIMARVFAPKLSEALGQPVVVENKPGANSVVGADFVKNAPADGHTLYLASDQMANMPFVVPNLPFRPVDDFTYITQCAFFYHVILVGPRSPHRTINDLIAAIRARPEMINVGSVGIARTVKFAVQAEAPVNIVNYRVTGDLLAAVSNGGLDVGIEVIAPSLPLIESGAVRALATSGDRRATQLPAITTCQEAGVPYLMRSWNGIIGPARLPAPVVERVAREMRRIMAMADVRERLAPLGVEITPSSPDEFTAFARAETATWAGMADRLVPR
ncbi:Bug family tripartite tricarboxylate transporter substrate binding protein [Muricoccus radiodurans]|uniref:Bug family tripartite tricarboxylate transporter substrate binding protein n=1 Tax=Muricoccus radiodurans TaxID=2231721 RepID=UPI003CF29BCA